MKSKNHKRNKQHWLKKFKQEPYFPFVLAFSILLILVPYPSIILWKGECKEFFKNLLPNLSASIVDVILLGILVCIISKKQQTTNNIQRWKDEIDAFRGWNEPEAMFRIVWNIKRLIANGETHLNLDLCFLSKAKLNSTNLNDSTFMHSNLKEASFTGSKLNRADLRCANLTGAYLLNADLTNANLIGTNLSHSCLDGADLCGVNFHRAILDHTSLNEVDISQVITFYKAKLDPKILSKIKSTCPEKLATIWEDTKKGWIVDEKLLEEIKMPNWSGWPDEGI